MSWVIGATALAMSAVVVSIFVTARLRRRQHERTVLDAVAGMSALLHAAPSPQRILLGEIADVLAAQDDVTTRLERRVRRLLPGPRDEAAARAEIEELLTEVLDLAEPSRLLADFVIEHAGAESFRAAITACGADTVRRAVRRIFAPVPDAPEQKVLLDRLTELAAGGLAGPVAAAAFLAGLPPGATTLTPDDITGSLPGGVDILAGGVDILADEQARFSAEIGTAPRLGTVDPKGIAAVARNLNSAIRRQIRLVTLLHDQAETIPRHRTPVEPTSQNVRKRLPDAEPNGTILRSRRRLVVPDIDLSGLQVALDAAGEVLTLAAERLDEHTPMQAIHLLASLRLPSPAGFPGRVFTQESLAQARPLAELGILHRLAIARWAADSLDTLHQRRTSLSDRLAIRAAEHLYPKPEHGTTREEPGRSRETLSTEHTREGTGPS